MRARVDGSGLQTILTAEKLDSGVAVGAGHVYWSWAGGIGRANLDGSEADPSFVKGGEGITGVAAMGEHIYWAGPGGVIGRAKLNGTEVEPEFIKGITGGAITGLAVSPEYIYWTNFWDSSIGRAHLDGSSLENEYVHNTHTPMGLALSEQYFYWAITYENHIGRALLSGAEKSWNFITTGLSSDENEQVGVAVDHQHVYWANPTTGTIGRADIDGREIEPGFIAGAGDPLGLTLAPTPEAAAQPATEQTTTSATLNGTVNPEGSTVGECFFEYGVSEAYGKTALCSSSPGSGYSPVAVSASVSGLAAGTTYHYRVVAASAQGASDSADGAFATLASAKAAETKEATKPAEAVDAELRAKASDGTGAITVGAYGGEQIGGAPLPDSAGKYFDVHRNTAGTFATIELQDCELGGGRSLWWQDLATGTWEPVLEPPAAYHAGSPACITATFTESTRPSVQQLTGTRFGTRFGEEPGSLEYGKCEAKKDGYYEEGKCAKPDAKNKGSELKGKYEWYAAPVPCYPQKKGYYEDSECKKEKAAKGKPKGTYEAGSGALSGVSATTKLEIESVGTVECASSATSGSLLAPKAASETIAFAGCKLAGSECSSQSQRAGTITTFPLEALLESEGEAADAELFPLDGDPQESVLRYPLMQFTCASAAYTVDGGFRGQTTGQTGLMSPTGETVFRPGLAEQEMQTTTAGHAHRTTITLTIQTTSTQPLEINPSPPGAG